MASQRQSIIGTSEMDHDELVILVDDGNREIGTCSKAVVHTGNTPLHRAFSVFVFNHNGELLLQQRAGSKKTWPLVWSNSCCGHPQPGETSNAAVRRRLREELQLTPAEIHEVLPNYRYRAEHLGVVENEICPVYVCWTKQVPVPQAEEVEAVSHVDWINFLKALKDPSDHRYADFSPWCREEAILLDQSPLFRKLWEQHTSIP